MKISMFWIDVRLPGNDYTVAMLSKLHLDKNRFDIEKLTKELTFTNGRRYRPKLKNTFATWGIRNPVTSVCVIFWQLPSQVMTKLFEYAIAHKLVPEWLRNLYISTGLKPILSNIKQLCIIYNYSQYVVIKNYYKIFFRYITSVNPDPAEASQETEEIISLVMNMER